MISRLSGFPKMKNSAPKRKAEKDAGDYTFQVGQGRGMCKIPQFSSEIDLNCNFDFSGVLDSEGNLLEETEKAQSKNIAYIQDDFNFPDNDTFDASWKSVTSDCSSDNGNDMYDLEFWYFIYLEKGVIYYYSEMEPPPELARESIYEERAQELKEQEAFKSQKKRARYLKSIEIQDIFWDSIRPDITKQFMDFKYGRTLSFCCATPQEAFFKCKDCNTLYCSIKCFLAGHDRGIGCTHTLYEWDEAAGWYANYANQINITELNACVDCEEKKVVSLIRVGSHSITSNQIRGCEKHFLTFLSKRGLFPGSTFNNSEIVAFDIRY